jgi:hypothetical protein
MKDVHLPFTSATPEFYIDGYYGWLESRPHEDQPSSFFQPVGVDVAGMAVRSVWHGRMITLSGAEQDAAEHDWRAGWRAASMLDPSGACDYSDLSASGRVN